MLSCTLKKYSNVKMVKTYMGLSGTEQRALRHTHRYQHTVCAHQDAANQGQKNCIPVSTDELNNCHYCNHLLKPTRKQWANI